MGLMNLLKIQQGQPAIAIPAIRAIPSLAMLENSDKIAGIATIAIATTTSPKTINISHSDAMAEKRRQKVLMMLATPPLTKRVIINDTDSDIDNMIITVGLHDVGTCELLIPKTRFDPFGLMLMIESLPNDESEVNNAAYLKQLSELTAHELIVLMRRANIDLALCDGELIATPAKWIDDELADLIRIHKLELINILENEG